MERENPRRERGISLIEGILYLVVALAIIIGGIIFFQQAQLANRVSQTQRASTLAHTRLVDQERGTHPSAGSRLSKTSTLTF